VVLAADSTLLSALQETPERYKSSLLVHRRQVIRTPLEDIFPPIGT
jgi:hypothetical protein